MDRLTANINRTDIWKEDSWKSVELYNDWFMKFAPSAFRDARRGVLRQVRNAFSSTQNLTDICVNTIKCAPNALSVLRMATAPPLAQDRLAGLANCNKSLIKTLEKGQLPNRMTEETLSLHLDRIASVINSMIDTEIFPWMEGKNSTPQQLSRSSAIVADRLTGVLSDPIIRNSQEKRQFDIISDYLDSKGYEHMAASFSEFSKMPELSYSFHVNIPVNITTEKMINIPADVAIMRRKEFGDFPLLVECKSAGDFTNTNKRRKEEAIKAAQLKTTYGTEIQFVLFLCGYFDTGYLGYEAAEGIDWRSEHRRHDFTKLGV